MKNIRRRGNFDNYIEYAYLHLYLKKKKNSKNIHCKSVYHFGVVTIFTTPLHDPLPSEENLSLSIHCR